MKKSAHATNRITRKEKEKNPILATINEDELEELELDESDEDELEELELDESDEDDSDDEELDELDEDEDDPDDEELDELDEDEDDSDDEELDELDEDEDDSDDEELDELDEDEDDSDDDKQQTPSNGKKPKKATIDDWKASLTDSTLSIKDLYTPQAMKHNKRTSAAGLITIVYAKKTGSRLVLSTELTERFNTRSEIHLTFAKSSLIIAQKPIDKFATYSTSLQGKRAVVYSKHLVDEIIDYFDLSFDDRTALTFSEGKFELIGDTAIVRIQMK